MGNFAHCLIIIITYSQEGFSTYFNLQIQISLNLKKNVPARSGLEGRRMYGAGLNLRRLAIKHRSASSPRVRANCCQCVSNAPGWGGEGF